MIRIVLLVISAILFALLGLSIAISKLDLLAWGLFFAVVSQLPWKE